MFNDFLVSPPSLPEKTTELFLYSFLLCPVPVFEGQLLPVYVFLNFLGYIWFVIWVDCYFFVRNDIIHTKVNIVRDSFHSRVHILIMEDIPVSRQEAPFNALYAVLRPHLYSSDTWFAPLEDCFINGNEMVRARQRRF